jgi:hypothetical protein
MIKAIPNFPHYFADTAGNIWSERTFGPKGKNRVSLKLRKLKPTKHYKNGYLFVTLSYRYKKKKYNKNVHRLILETFTGPCPVGMEACHKDGNKLNNKLYNLKWGTHSDNEKDKTKHGTRFQPDNKGERHGRAKLTNLDVMEIKKLLKRNCLKGYEIAKIYGVTRKTISSINLRRTWRHI